MKNQHTPWGPAQTSREVAPGITEVSTASHGGLHLSPDLWRQLTDKIPYVAQYAPPCWLEEDCDYCVAVLAFPELFTIGQIRAAVHTFSGESKYQPGVRHWLATSNTGQALKAQVEAFEKMNAELWEFGGCSSNKRGWMIHLTRIGDRAHQDVQVLDYPDQQFYTDGAIEKIRLPAEAPAPIRPAFNPAFREEDCGGVFDGERVWSDTELGGAPGF